MTQSPVTMAVIGVGYFGKFHAEKVANLPDTELVAVADADLKLAKKIARKHKTRAVGDYRELLDEVDAVCIAVPTRYHSEIASEFLNAGVDVLVEKPITPDLQSAEQLVALAREKNRILQVGHLERFSGVVEALRKYVQRPLYIDSVRISPFKARSTDVNVILDVMIHDLDLILSLLDAPILTVDAAGAPVFSESEDIASVRIKFANGCVANIVASRISLKSERKMRIFEIDKYVAVDLEKRNIRVVWQSEGNKPLMPGLPPIDMRNEDYSEGDALEREIRAFADAVANRTPPIVSGEAGMAALEAAVRVNESLRAHAEFINREAGPNGRQRTA